MMMRALRSFQEDSEFLLKETSVRLGEEKMFVIYAVTVESWAVYG